MKAILGFLLTVAVVLGLHWLMGHAETGNVFAAVGLALVGLAIWWPLWRRYGWN